MSKFVKPETPMEEWTDEELEAYEADLKRTERLARIKELEKDKQRKKEAPKSDPENSTDNEPNVDNIEEQAYKIFQESLKKS